MTELLCRFRNREKADLLREVLDVLGRVVGASRVSLVEKLFVGKKEFTLRELCAWSLSGKSHDSLTRYLFDERLRHGWWPGLTSRELLFVPSEASQRPASRLLLVPLYLDQDIYGLLTFVVDVVGPPSRLLKRFLRVIARIFQFWIARLDLEKRLREVIDFIPTPSLLIDANGAIKAWNKAAEQITGWKAEQVLEKGNYEHAIPFYGERRPTAANLILEADPEWEGRYMEYRQEGDDAFALTYCPAIGAYLTSKTSRLYSLNGRLWGSVHTVRDVTYERQMEKHLDKSESMFRAITDFANVGMILLYRDRVIYCNDHFVDLIGIPGSAITPDDLVGWAHPDDRDMMAARLDHLFHGMKEPVRFDFRSMKGDGICHYRCYGQSIDYEDRPAVYFIVDDITKQKDLEHKARQNELRVWHEDRLRALGTMAASLAHELNQPLNTIRVITDGLVFGSVKGWAIDQNEIIESLEMISKQVMRMSGIITNVRNFARQDRWRAQENVDVNEAVENVLSMVGKELEAQGVRAHKARTRDVPLVKATLNRLEQVIMNLVVNAKEAFDVCGRNDRQIWIRTGRKGRSVVIEVSDNATGIAASDIPKVFDPFFTSKEGAKGTGLGLTISQSIIAEFGGHIEASNNRHGGATFVVTLPAEGERREDSTRGRRA